MTSVALLVLTIAVLPAFGLAAWIWLTIASEPQIDEVGSVARYPEFYFERRTDTLESPVWTRGAGIATGQIG